MKTLHIENLTGMWLNMYLIKTHITYDFNLELFGQIKNGEVTNLIFNRIRFQIENKIRDQLYEETTR
jgi:hypothetical protein